MAQYGTVKVDFITFTSGTSTDVTLTVSSLKNIAETGIVITGNVTAQDIYANGNVYVTSGVYIDDTLQVTGVVGIGGETTVSGHFNASGLACVSGLQVLNDATVDGNLSVTGSISGNSLFIESGCFASGTGIPNNNAHPYDFYYWRDYNNKALTDAEVLQNYNANKADLGL